MKIHFLSRKTSSCCGKYNTDKIFFNVAKAFPLGGANKFSIKFTEV